jgi:hypothetical protein
MNLKDDVDVSVDVENLGIFNLQSLEIGPRTDFRWYLSVSRMPLSAPDFLLWYPKTPDNVDDDVEIGPRTSAGIQ